MQGWTYKQNTLPDKAGDWFKLQVAGDVAKLPMAICKKYKDSHA